LILALVVVVTDCGSQRARRVGRANGLCVATAGRAHGALYACWVSAVVRLNGQTVERRRNETDVVDRAGPGGNSLSGCVAVNVTQESAARCLQRGCAGAVGIRTQTVMRIHLAQTHGTETASHADEGVAGGQRASGRCSAVVVNTEARVDLEFSLQALTQVFNAFDVELGRAVRDRCVAAVAARGTRVLGLGHTTFDGSGNGHRRLRKSSACCEGSQSN